MAQDTLRVEHYSRQPDGRWLFAVEDDLDATVALPSIGCTLSLSEIYEKVDGLREPAAVYR